MGVVVVGCPGVDQMDKVEVEVGGGGGVTIPTKHSRTQTKVTNSKTRCEEVNRAWMQRESTPSVYNSPELE